MDILIHFDCELSRTFDALGRLATLTDADGASSVFA